MAFAVQWHAGVASHRLWIVPNHQPRISNSPRLPSHACAQLLEPGIAVTSVGTDCAITDPMAPFIHSIKRSAEDPANGLLPTGQFFSGTLHHETARPLKRPHAEIKRPYQHVLCLQRIEERGYQGLYYRFFTGIVRIARRGGHKQPTAFNGYREGIGPRRCHSPYRVKALQPIPRPLKKTELRPFHQRTRSF